MFTFTVVIRISHRMQRVYFIVAISKPCAAAQAGSKSMQDQVIHNLNLQVQCPLLFDLLVWLHLQLVHIMSLVRMCACDDPRNTVLNADDTSITFSLQFRT